MAKKKVTPIPNIPAAELSRGIGELGRESLLDYGNYVNNHRHFASLADGTKVSYKRLIYTAMEQPKGKEISSATLIPAVAKYHPHDTSGILGLNASLVRSGVFSGSGFFGSVDIDGTDNPPAAPRYTKNRLSDLYWGIMGDLIKEVPYVESPQGPLEPAYLPVCLPLCLYLSDVVSGIGVGASAVYPNFSPVSLYQAYIHDNPMLLEPRINILMDKNASELESIWRTGKGRIVYAYKIYRATGPDGKTEGVMFEGDTGIFTPNFKNKKLVKLLDEGKVFMENMTDQAGPKLFLGRVPGARGITIEEIEDIASKICYSATTYNLNVTTGETAYRIPLRDWIHATYTNYINLVSGYNQKRIEKTKFDIAVFQAIPGIAGYVLGTNPAATDDEISAALSIPLEVVKAVMSKPISTLRKNKDNSAKIKDLKALLKEYKSFDPVLFTEDIISKL